MNSSLEMWNKPTQWMWTICPHVGFNTNFSLLSLLPSPDMCEHCVLVERSKHCRLSNSYCLIKRKKAQTNNSYRNREEPGATKSHLTRSIFTVCFSHFLSLTSVDQCASLKDFNKLKCRELFSPGRKSWWDRFSLISGNRSH